MLKITNNNINYLGEPKVYTKNLKSFFQKLILLKLKYEQQGFWAYIKSNVKKHQAIVEKNQKGHCKPVWAESPNIWPKNETVKTLSAYISDYNRKVLILKNLYQFNLQRFGVLQLEQ